MIRSYYILLAALTAVLLWTLSQPGRIQTDAWQLLPDFPAFAKLRSEAQQDPRFVLLVSAEPAHSEDAENAYRALAAQLAGTEGIVLQGLESSLLNELRALYQAYTYQLISAADRQLLAQQPGQFLQRSLAELYQVGAHLRVHTPLDDPFNVSGRWLQSSIDQLRGSITTAADGATYIDKQQKDSQRRHWLLAGSLVNEQSTERLLAEIEIVASDYPQVDMLRSGLPFHSAAGKALAKREISTLGFASMLGIALLFIWVMRNRRALALLLTSLLAAMCGGATACLLVFDNINIITLSFGSTILGLAVDYCYHLLCMRADKRKGTDTKLLVRAVLLGALTSICAYLLQCFSPFPALQQLGVFIAGGLTLCALTVALFAKSGQADQAIRIPLAFYQRFFSALAVSLATPRRALLALLLFCLPVLILLVPPSADDDLRNLNTSSDTMMAAEATVSRLTGQSQRQQWWQTTRSNTELALQDLEWLHRELAEPGADHLSMASFIPSQKQQRENLQLLSAQLDQGGLMADFCERIGSDCSAFARPGDFQPGLLPEHLPNSLTEALPELVDGDSGELRFYGPGPESLSEAQLAAIEQRGLYYRQQGEHLQSLFREVREQVAMLIAGFVLALALLLTLYLNKSALKVLIPLLLPLAVALAAANLQGITVFHLMALLVVLGICVDNILFYSLEGPVPAVWTASSLSCLTSVLAFGTLSLSQVPVLQQFGVVIVSGLLSGWLLCAASFFVFDRGTIAQHIQGSKPS